MANQLTDLKFVETNEYTHRCRHKASVAFYRDVLGATVLREGEPTFLRLANIWITINGCGGGTDDKPEVTSAPPRDPNLLSNFLNLRVADIRRYSEVWSSRGAKFITEPPFVHTGLLPSKACQPEPMHRLHYLESESVATLGGFSKTDKRMQRSALLIAAFRQRY